MADVMDDANADNDDHAELLRRRQQEHEEEMERLLLRDEQHDGEEDHDGGDHDGPDGDGGEDVPMEEPQQGGVPPDDGFGPPQHANANAYAPPPQTIFKRLSYLETSFVAALGLLCYAFRTRRQWYLALVFLASTKFSLVVFGNALVALAIYSFDVATRFFLDGLRLQEAEGLQDFFRWNVTETCLALTMFRSELKLQTAIHFLALIGIKCCHHVCVLRETHVRMTQESIVPRRVPGLGAVVPAVPYSHLKLWAMLLLLQWIDLWIVQYTGTDLVEVGPSVQILFCFEAAILLVSAWSHLLLLYLHLIDGLLHYGHDRYRSVGAITRLLHVWKEYKATLTFAVELQAQAIQFVFYLSFFAIVLTYYGMPINLFREVYVSFASLRERLVAFMKYRRLMASMNRFESATREQLVIPADDETENDERVEGEDADGDAHAHHEHAHEHDAPATQYQHCIICRDEMTVHEDIKVLPVCHHLFHKSCLREWLVQQQSCPTCRSDIAAMEAQEAARRATEAAAAALAAAVAEQQEQASQQVQAQQQQAAESVPTTTPALVPEDAPQQQQLRPEYQAQQPMLPTVGRSLEEIRQLREQLLRRQLQQQAVDEGTKRVQFTPTPIEAAAAAVTTTFPALYRVVLESGAQVFDDCGMLVRTVPPGRVLLCHGDLKAQPGRVLLRIPDGWVSEDAVVRVHTIQAR